MEENELLVTNIEDVEQRIKQLCGEEFSVANLDYSDVLYVTDKCLSARLDSKDAKYAWINTGKVYCGHYIYISLLRPHHYDSYRGGYVGTAQALIKQTELTYAPAFNRQKLIDKCKAPAVVNGATTTAVLSSSFTSILESVKNLLLIDYWSSSDGLTRYIKTVGGRLTELVNAKEMTDSYVLNSLGDAVVNTGLLDKYGNAICLLYRLNKALDSYIVDRIIDSKRALIDAGFPMSVNMYALKPLTFMNEDDYLDDISMDCFDLSARSFQHSIEERFDRLPETLRAQGMQVCAVTVNDCIRRELAIWVCDHRYARPVYNAKLAKIVWYLPLHISTGLSHAPELVAIFDKDKDLGIYSLKTILPYDSDIEDRVLALNLYNPWRWE